MAQSLIKLENVWKTYTMGESQVHALQGINLDIKKGEFVAVMGPSGSGKSTAVNMIGCLDVPSRGHIYLESRDISTLGESRLAQIRGSTIGFIFQRFNLINTLTAVENVALPMLFQQVSREERLKTANKYLDMLDLGERKSHRPNELSGGQQQRVAIARSLANDPPVILADEPTGNLDSKTGAIVIDFLEKINKEGKTIIMVSHDPGIAKHAKRVVYLKDGKIVPKL